MKPPSSWKNFWEGIPFYCFFPLPNSSYFLPKGMGHYSINVLLQNLLSGLSIFFFTRAGQQVHPAPLMLTGKLVCSYRSTANPLVSFRQVFGRDDDKPRKKCFWDGKVNIPLFSGSSPQQPSRHMPRLFHSLFKHDIS